MAKLRIPLTSIVPLFVLLFAMFNSPAFSFVTKMLVIPFKVAMPVVNFAPLTFRIEFSSVANIPVLKSAFTSRVAFSTTTISILLLINWPAPILFLPLNLIVTAFSVCSFKVNVLPAAMNALIASLSLSADQLKSVKSKTLLASSPSTQSTKFFFTAFLLLIRSMAASKSSWVLIQLVSNAKSSTFTPIKRVQNAPVLAAHPPA